MYEFGCQSMAGYLSRVMMRRPGESLLSADAKAWHYNNLFNAQKAIEEYEGFTALVEKSGAKIDWIEDNNDGLADAMFTRDASFVTNAGAVLLRMKKPLRAPEPELHRAFYEGLGIPVIGRISGSGLLEGGDLVWLDDKTLVSGMGYRSNREGVDQLAAILKPHGITVLGFDLPNWGGSKSCLHLMSLISPLTEKKFLVYAPLIPAALWRLMESMGIELIHAPADEFDATYGLNTNVMPLEPDLCLMIEGMPKTRIVMEASGTTVMTFEGQALCLACEGGPTCLTNPISRLAQ